MGIKIFLDDIRDPPNNDPSWVLVRNIKELILLIKTKGEEIDLISLDHDLGDNQPSGYDFLKWLEKKVFEKEYKEIPKITFHTRNPVGKRNLTQGLIRINQELQRQQEEEHEQNY